MSEALIGLGDLFAASAPAPAAVSGMRPLAAVAVLTAGLTPQPAAAAVALALADALGTRSALVACVGAAPPGGLLRTPASVAAATRLRRDHVAVHPCGRLLWLPGADSPDDSPSEAAPRAAAGDADAPAAAGAAAADAPAAAGVGAAGAAAAGAGAAAAGAVATAAAELAALLGQAAQLCGLPAVLGIGGPRSAALDHVLARHDGVVVVLPAAAAEPLTAATLGSITRLGPPAAAMAAPRRLDAAAALAGLRAPRAAAEAVAVLGLGQVPR